LAYAHERGVIHRDIKPANILLSDANAHVADFGVARAMDPGTDPGAITLSGIQIGTPAYMSPEQAASDPSLDGRSDIYSLGCVLYEMLAGRPPFDGSKPGSVIARHALDPVPPIRTVRPSVSPALEQVTMTALAKEPSRRYANAREMQRALQEVELDDRAPRTSVTARHRLRRALTGAVIAVPLLRWLTGAALD